MEEESEVRVIWLCGPWSSNSTVTLGLSLSHQRGFKSQLCHFSSLSSEQFTSSTSSLGW